MSPSNLRQPLTHIARTSWLLLVSMAASCNFGEVEVFDVPPPEQHDPVLEFLAADESAAGALGWAEGRIPDAQIRIVPDDSAGNAWRFEGTTGADGRIELEGVPAAQYVVTTFRLLNESERATLQGSGTVAFVGTALVRLDGTTETRMVTVPASERRALVISEFEFDVPLEGSGVLVPAGYIELYNNADTTIYLDGKLIARSYHILNDYSTRPCWMFDHMRVDAAGLYAAAFEKFPGSGRDYPLLPGQTAVVAVDGIDHRPFAPHAFDLSGADFEFRGAGDVDNPAVPNMVNVGIREGTPYGLAWPAASGPVFVSDAVDVTALPRTKEPDTPQEYARFPADGILETAFFLDLRPGEPPLCVPLIHPRFMGTPATWYLGWGAGLSIQRKALLTLPNGQVVLQHTNSPAEDFFGAANTPGTVGGR